MYFFFVTLILQHAKMRVLNASSFGRADIIFRARTFVYHKLVRVMVRVSLKGYFLVVNFLVDFISLFF